MKKFTRRKRSEQAVLLGAIHQGAARHSQTSSRPGGVSTTGVNSLLNILLLLIPGLLPDIGGIARRSKSQGEIIERQPLAITQHEGPLNE
ncbi:uncharacterized protein METZ01_LOCUS490780, partial [marine metagenome]